ncbi:hypothetical protein [Komagataeibacter swingsii]|nr:hypothetical protein [Komagataeibacter swingsii]
MRHDGPKPARPRLRACPALSAIPAVPHVSSRVNMRPAPSQL